MQKRQSYTKEFKEKTVSYILEHSKPVTQISLELDIPTKTLYAWIEKYKADPVEPFVGSGNRKLTDKETEELQKRIKDLEEENEILKKAMHYFAKDRN